jgi:hypothetical protein
MNRPNDVHIEAFRQGVERFKLLMARATTLDIDILRADELPSMIANPPFPYSRQSLQEEQAALGDPVRLRHRRIQLESELRQEWLVIIAQLRAATYAATMHVTAAAGGTEALRAFPFARWHLEELARHREMAATLATADRLFFLHQTWLTIDFAVASLHEIRWDASRNLGPT